MEEEVQYSTLVFKKEPKPYSVNKEEQTIYSEVAVKPGSAVSAPHSDAAVSEGARCGGALRVLAVSLCVLLLTSLSVLTYLVVSLSGQRSEVQRLSSEMFLLQNQTERLTEQRDLLRQESVRLKSTTAELQNLTLRLNWTLEVVLSFSQFPVSDYCPRGQCEPCLDGWLHFQSSCYFIYDEDSWRTWDQSRTFCRGHSPVTDLLTISSQQEQEFVHDHLEFYFDIYHGFWIGLSQQNQSWVWVDGTNDSLRFWMEKPLGKPGPKALMIPQQNVTTSWSPAENVMKNKFICESRVLTID